MGRLRALLRPLAGIEGRLVLLLLLVILLAMQLIGAVLLQQLQSYYVSSFTDQITGHAEAVARQVARDLGPTPDPKAVSQIVGLVVGPNSQESFLVVDAAGTVVATSTEVAPAVGAHVGGETGVGACLQGRTVTRRGADAALPAGYVRVSVPVLSSANRVVGCVLTTGSLAAIERTLASIRVILLRTTAAALGAVALVALLLARTITGPLAELTTRARELAAGHFDRRIEVRSADEIGNLASMFNYLSQRLRETLGEISAEKRRADAILTYMADGILSAGPDGTVTMLNPAAARLLGSSADVIGQPLREVAPSAVAESLAAGLQPVVRVDLPEQGQVLIARIAELRDEAGAAAGWVVVLADATEQERLDAQRRQFVANVSHELRTPLTAIKSYTESLLDGAAAEPATAERFLQVILAETDRMVRLIADLLQLSELEPHRAAWRRRPFRLEQTCAEAMHRIERRARTKGLLLRQHLGEDTPAAIGDPDRILQVVSNLLGNAVDFTPAGGTISVSVQACPDGVRCSVADTGVGIPEADRPHIFERFYRVDPSRARELGGTGLGLSIAKEIVEAHGGEISLRSTVGAGTEISFTLPAAGADGEAPA